MDVPLITTLSQLNGASLVASGSFATMFPGRVGYAALIPETEKDFHQAPPEVQAYYIANFSVMARQA